MSNVKIIEKNEEKTYILKGIFTEFSTKHHGRIYDEKDYLPHIEELKNRTKKDNG